jgi:diadenosine tetraphosphatase ApaH/serine/threonine PP2A family protein phosphatase
MMSQHVGYDEARVVVHEGHQVDPLVPSQEEGEDVGLPELVRGGPLKAPGRMLALADGRCRLGQQSLLVQDASYPGLAYPETIEPA